MKLYLFYRKNPDEHDNLNSIYAYTEDKEYADKAIQPLAKSGKRVRAIPQEWTQSFGKYFYRNERDIATLEKQDESEWKLLMDLNYIKL